MAVSYGGTDRKSGRQPGSITKRDMMGKQRKEETRHKSKGGGRGKDQLRGRGMPREDVQQSLGYVEELSSIG